jgi:uncharacterized protein involved in exopolysaccharide biosynthesis
MTANSWLDDEPPASASLRQAGCLVLAGLRRKKSFVIVVACCAASLAGAFAWTKYSYTPEFVLRVVEADNDPTGVPRPRRQLAEYVRTAVLTSELLLDVMSHHDLYAGLARKNPRAALESFREDIDVEVRQNYFVEERAVGGAPRSARLVVSYRSADPAVAVSVTHELGELVVKREQATRKNEATRAAELASEDVDRARQALALRRSAVAAMRDEIDRQDRGVPERSMELIGLLGSLPALEARLDEQERRAASLALGASLEQHGIGTVYEVVNDALLAPDAGAQSGRALLASTAFVLALPLLAMAVGAFASGKACA